MSVMVDLMFLDRTLRIRYGQGAGSAVYVEFEGVQMLVTAAHVVQGLLEGDRIGIRYKSTWGMVDVTGVARCEFGTDVCAIRLGTNLGEGLQEEHLTGGIAVGEEVAYCGFPLDLELYGMPGNLGWPMGFVKSAIFSGGLERPSGGYDYLFDTINNPGFSGGPIIKRENGKLRVVAIVNGYKYDAPVPIYQKAEDGNLIKVPDYVVKPNSGFMIGTPIFRAVAAAKTLI